MKLLLITLWFHVKILNLIRADDTKFEIIKRTKEFITDAYI